MTKKSSLGAWIVVLNTEEIMETIKQIRERVQKGEEIAKEVIHLLNEQNKCFKPTCTDTQLIRPMYEAAFKDHGEISVYEREQFLYFVMLMYSPNYLCGVVLSQGIRSLLAEIFKMKPCTISVNLHQSVFFYKAYDDFRKGVYRIWDCVNEAGLL